ncbi:squalene synthase HpnC [Iodobacter sp.]|uniref:squalene synthase HpnC n=1 Tax=Iodobacter sp. TaxID=1915058 RepID=UPI0025F514DF|nr:squalene synthase HpnC [Iodobacter sp.]
MVAITPEQAVGHYENFPVASLLLPRKYRKAVAAVYHFARHADDLADEGDATPAERLAALAACRAELALMAAGQTPLTARYQALAVSTQQYQIPIQLYHDLLDAFTQDVTKHRFADFGELIYYCRRSANPVGRILLHIFGLATPRNLALSDGICSALQLINFWQDVEKDWANGRVYFPQADLERFGVSEAQIAAGEINANWRRLMAFQVRRSQKMLHAGAPLGKILPGRVGLEIRLTILGGDAILEKLKLEPDVFRHRPVLVWRDWPKLLWRALRAK